MLRSLLAALYLVTVPGAAAWAQTARVLSLPPSAVSVPISLPIGAPGLAPALLAPGLTAPGLSAALAASAPAPAPAASAAAPAQAAAAAVAAVALAPAASAGASSALAPAAAASVPAAFASASAAASAVRAAAPNAAGEADATAANFADGLGRAPSGSLAAAPRRWFSALTARGAAFIAAPRVLDGRAAPPAPPTSGPALKLKGYLAGTFGAQVASNALQVTMPLLFLKITGSASAAAFAVTIGSALDAVGTLVGGWLTDRVGSKPVLLATTVTRGAVVLALPFLALAGHLSLPAVAAAYFVESFVRGVADTARSSLPKELAGQDKGGLLDRIIAKNQTFFEAGGIVGPFLAGALIAHMGGVASAAALWLAPAAFAFVALAYLAIPKPAAVTAAAPAAAPQAPKTRRVLDGWMRWALAGTFLLTVSQLKGLLPAIFATQFLHSDAAAAWLTGLFGVGGLLGSLAYGRWSAALTLRRWLVIGGLGTLALAGAFLPGAFWPAALGVSAFAGANVAARLALSAAIQSRAEPGKTGAAMGPARFTANVGGLAVRFLSGLAFVSVIAPWLSLWLVGGGLALFAGANLYVARRATAPRAPGRQGEASSARRPSPVTGLPGRLIVVEGLDGSGKSTQMLRLKEELEARGLKVVVTSWNSSETVSEAVKKAKKSRSLTPKTFALMNAADLADRLDKVVRPALEEGAVVLADRWFFTALARDRVRGMDARWLRRLYNFALKPDLTLYFSLPVETAISRVLGRAEAKSKAMLSEDFEEEESGKVLGQNPYAVGRDLSFSKDDRENFSVFQTRVTDEYERQAREFGFRRVDAAQSRDVISGEVLETVLKELGPLESFAATGEVGTETNLFDKDPVGDAESLRRNYTKEKRGPHFYFRNMLRPMQRRFAQLLDLAAMPQVFLHGNPHVDQYSKSGMGAALVDFDRSLIGPYGWDIVRFLVSLSLRQKKPAEGLLDANVLKQFEKGYLRGLHNPERPFSQARALADVEPDDGEMTTDAYLATNQKWAREMRDNPLPADAPEVAGLLRSYLSSRDELALLERYEVKEAGRGFGTMGNDRVFVVLSPKERSDGDDSILLEIKRTYSDPDTEHFHNPFDHEGKRMIAATELYAPGWDSRPGYATLNGVQYYGHELPTQNVKLKKMLTLEGQADLAYAVGTQLGRAHRLSIQGGVEPETLEAHFKGNVKKLIAASATIRDELMGAYARYLRAMRRAGLTPPKN